MISTAYTYQCPFFIMKQETIGIMPYLYFPADANQYKCKVYELNSGFKLTNQFNK